MSTVKAEMILEGEYSEPELDDLQQLFLDNLTRVTETDKSFKLVTREEF